MSRVLPTCPICHRPAEPEADSFPFCSPRCRLIDLGNWSDERYVVSAPAEQAEDGDDSDGGPEVGPFKRN